MKCRMAVINEKHTIMYILKFQDIFKTVIWGGDKIGSFKGKKLKQESVGESWEISSVEGDVSIVANGADAGMTLTQLILRDQSSLVGEHIWKRYGSTFPLLIKFIDAHDNLSIQVHPNDRLARERHNSFGKTELWYVIDAEPGAGLYSGFKQAITPEEYVQRVADNTIMDVLQFHPVAEGDVFFLPSGRIHAIGKGVFVAEIQQTSNITYRIYDYNRVGKDGKQRELHTEWAKDAIDYRMYDNLKTHYTPLRNEAVELVSCEYFTTNLLQIDTPIVRPVALRDSFVTYQCMGGKAVINDGSPHPVELQQGESCLVPAAIDQVTIQPCDEAILLESFVE